MRRMRIITGLAAWVLVVPGAFAQQNNQLTMTSALLPPTNQAGTPGGGAGLPGPSGGAPLGGVPAAGPGGLSGNDRDLPINRRGTLLPTPAPLPAPVPLPAREDGVTSGLVRPPSARDRLIRRIRDRSRDQVVILNPGYTGVWYGDGIYGRYDTTTRYRDGLKVSGYDFGTPPPVVGQAPSSEQGVPAAPMTLVETADAALAAGQWGIAARLYQKHLQTSKDDHLAERSLAIALLGNRETAQAVAVMAMAYTQEPGLAAIPIDLDTVGEGPLKFRELFNAASTYANRVKTGSAWLTAGVLAQAEGRDDVAKRVLARGKVSDAVTAKFAEVLGQAPSSAR